MTEVERLAAIEEIKLVKSRYFRFGDTKDLVSMRTLFADDCVVDCSGSVTDPTTGEDAYPAVGSGELYGADAVMAAFGKGEGITSIHHGYTPDVEILGDTSAKSIWAMTDRLFFADPSPVAQLTGYGHYHETYEKIDGRWKIKTLRLTRLRVEVVRRD